MMVQEMKVQAAATEEWGQIRLTVPQAARIAGKHPNTIRNWIYRGLLPAQKVGKYGRYGINRSDLDETLRYKPTSAAK